MAPTTASVRDAAQEIAKAGTLLPHQLAAFSALDQALSPEQRQTFTADWRAKGSPAAAASSPAVRPSNPLTGFPYFSQISADGSDGSGGWRQCQTSSLAMALAYLGVGGIRDDSDYLRVVQRHGDTTSQAAHQAALRELGVKARFVTSCSASQLQAEIRAGLPAALGYYHRGPVGAPSGGGHWLACFGFTPHGWIVNDPFGSCDLVNGGFAAQGGTSGRAQRYSYRNFNPRWLAEGPASGWAWLFS
jgi:hypothetical protein